MHDDQRIPAKVNEIKVHNSSSVIFDLYRAALMRSNLEQ